MTASRAGLRDHCDLFSAIPAHEAPPGHCHGGTVDARSQRRDGINSCASEASGVGSVEGDTGAGIAWRGGRRSGGHAGVRP